MGKKDFKYFVGYKDGRKFGPVCILILKMIAYRKDFHETKYMYLLIKGDELLEKYNKIWGKVNKSIKKGFDSEPTYNEKHLKTKIKSLEG